MKLKRIVCVFLIFLLVLGITACGKKTDAQNPTTKKSNDTTKAQEPTTIVTADKKVYEIRTEKSDDGTVTITVYSFDAKSGESNSDKIRSLRYGLNTNKNDGTYYVEVTDYLSGNFVMFRTNSISKDSVKSIEDTLYYKMLWAGLDGTVSETDATEKIVSVVGESERESVFCEGFEISDDGLYYTFFIEKQNETPAYYRVNVTTGEVTLKTASGVLI